MTRPKVSACLLSWKRPQHLQHIVDSLNVHDFIDEILVWNNDPQVTLQLRGDKVRVIDSDRNLICYGRFKCAQQARNEIIYVQDDDVIVGNVPCLYKHFLADDTCITHALSATHFRARDRFVYPEAHVALLGWGSLFRKRWRSVLDRYTAAFGEDPLFLREADKFFSILLGRRHRTVLGQLHHFSDASTPGIALWREPQHDLMKALAICRARRILRESTNDSRRATWNVVISCHDGGQFLNDAVQSVLRSDVDYVVTIVADSLTGNMWEMRAEPSPMYPQIDFVQVSNNVGASYFRNRGVAHVDSLYVLTLDADDLIGPNYLYEAENLLRAGTDVVNPDAILFGNCEGRWKVPEQTSLGMLLQRNSVHYCSAFRRCCWAQVAGFDEKMAFWGDYDYWIRLAANGARIRGLSGDHFYYRQHGLSRSSAGMHETAELRSRIRDKHRELFASRL